MKRFLSLILCLFIGLGMSFGQEISIDFNQGTLTNNTWVSTNEILTATISTTNTATYSLIDNTILINETQKTKASTCKISFVISLDHFSEYEISGLACTLKNNAKCSINVNGTQISEGSPKNIDINTTELIVSKDNNSSTINFEISNLIIKLKKTGEDEPTTDEDEPIERYPATGTAYKIHFVGTDKYIVNESDSVFVLGGSNDVDYKYMFVSNSNSSNNKYLVNGGGINSIYDSSCAYKIYLTKNLYNALLNKNGKYLGYNKVTKEFVECETELTDLSSNISTLIDLIPVPYPYTTVKMVKDDINEEGTRPGYSFGEYFASIYLPFPFVMPDGIEAYKGVKDNGNFIKMERVEGSDIPAGAYILYKTSDDAMEHLILPSTANPTTDVSNNMLIGSTKNPGVNEDAIFDGIPYVLAKHTTEGYKQVGFYKYTGTIYPKGKAIYVKNESISESIKTQGFNEGFNEGFIVDFQGGEDIQTPVTVIPTDNIYDLTGRKVSELGKGINIYNGKKIIK